MKTTKLKTATLLFALCGLSAPNANAQFEYRQYLYPSTSTSPNSYMISSVALGNIHSTGGPGGYHVIGTYGTTPAGASNYNFEIRVTDSNGDYGSATPWSYFNSFHVYKGPACGTGPSVILTDTYGMSVIETGNAISIGGAADPFYAVVAAVGDGTQYGCAFVLLHSEGARIASSDAYVYYEFPNGASFPSKPYITESLVTPGDYYITGAYSLNGSDEMYVIKVNGSSAGISHFPLWSRRYTSGSRLRPAGILESPHNSNDVAIVGVNVQPNIRREDGFFMKLDANNGGVLIFKVYGNTTPVLNEFTSFAPAFSVLPGKPVGYIIGGRTLGTPGFASWMMKVDQNGVIGWNRALLGNAGTNQEISGVLERASVNNTYEYFGVTSTGTGNMTVFKLDNNGLPNTSGTGTQEFEYNLTGGGPAYITCINSGSAYGDGINVFGCNPSTNEVYAVKAYFSGESGCNEFLGGATTDMSGPNSILTPAVNNNPGLFDYGINCGDYAITAVQRVYANPLPLAYQGVVQCNTSFIAGASNLRTAATTGIATSAVNEADFSVFPNPATDHINISYNVSTQGQVNIDLYNYMGQHLSSLKSTEATPGTYNEHINVSSLNLPAGVYFIKGAIGTSTYQQKIIVK